jgi:hypothetical protein
MYGAREPQAYGVTVIVITLDSAGLDVASPGHSILNFHVPTGFQPLQDRLNCPLFRDWVVSKSKLSEFIA